MGSFSKLLGGNFASFAGKSFIYAGGNLVQKSSQLLLIPLLTHTLSPAEYGFYGAAIAITGVLGPIIDMGMSASLVRFIHEHYDDPGRLAAYLKVSFLLRLGSALVGSISLGFLLVYIWRWLFPGDSVSAWTALWIAGIAVGTVLIDFACAYYQAKSNAFMFVLGKIGQTGLQLVLVLVALLVLELGVGGVIGAQALGAMISGTVVLGMFYFCTLWKVNTALDLSDIRHNLRYGLPLVPHRIGNWLRSAADRVILSKFLPLATVGFYQLAYSIGNILSVFVTCLDLAFAPYYYRVRKLGGVEGAARMFNVYSSCYLFFLGTICISLILFCREIISVLAPEDYGGTSYIVPLIVFSIYLQGQYTLVVKPLFYHKRTGIVPFLTLGPALLGTVLNIVMIPIFGVMAAVWTTVLMYFATFIGVAIASSRIERFGFPMAISVLCNLTVSIVALVATFNQPPAWELPAVICKGFVIICFSVVGVAFVRGKLLGLRGTFLAV